VSVHLLSIVGARPQFVKAAMVVEAIRAYSNHPGNGMLLHTLIHTGQHYDHKLSEVFFQQLPLPEPDYNLGVGSGTHGKQTGALLAAIEEVLIKEHPDVVIVYGDTNSTVAGAMAAAKLNISVAHVEAGLRSFNRRMPEEINRVVTDHISAWLFCPTQSAVKHLASEGITSGVYQSGDVMLDAVLKFQETAMHRSDILKQLEIKPSEYALFTMHRAENTDSAAHIASNIELLVQWSRPVVFPVHPRTWHRMMEVPTLKPLADKLQAAEHVKLIDPVSYLDMLVLERHARVVLTDSGGVQKEAFFFGVPCVTFRTETEWTETLLGGWNRLSGSEDPKRSLDTFERLRAGNGMRPVGLPNLDEFGRGGAAKTIVHQLLEALDERRN
jgi:UDP-GlcNAc3NAcA epimerase